MSLRRFEAGLVLAFLLVCLDEALSELSNKTGHLVVAQDSDRISTIKSVAENRTFDGNNTALEKRRSREGGGGANDEKHGTNSVQGSRKKKKSKHQKSFMEKMLPMMIIPFLVSTSMIPMMLIGLKIMILKSAFIGKIGILLMLLNMFRRRTSGEGGIFTHNVNANDVAMEHYGYHGDEEYGVYVN
ncbi:uncharacterized protein LOC108906955 [Anoplophora glabripennis]|uniref:uncharacterized protein LOC108906955 n=1 Tax=Anoplophora glabripennis TaxID=217634 RepID=UPI0008755627|nr:uncharacterized protein LOC108906955 [Anoplophora glabripennis]